MPALPRITAAERRARLVRRHLLTASTRVTTPLEAADALLALHATDPATVFLAAAARMRAPTVAAIDRALYDAASGTSGDDRPPAPALERIRCMRRTMFVLPAALAPSVRSATVKDSRRHRADALTRLHEALGWDERRYATVEQAALDAITARGEVTAAQLAVDVPALREQIVTFPGKPYESRQRVSSPVLGALAAEGRIRRGRPAGSWTSAQFRWAPAQPLPEVPPAEARATLARHYLAAFGPVTVDDLKWWTGWTLTDARTAVAAVGAQAVELDEGTGYLLPGDLEPPADDEPGAALQPSLDPTAMGWRHRHWYLDPDHTAALFDCNGNIGPTVWWNGRVIGAWAQDSEGRVNHHLLADPGRAARAAVEEEAARLAAFLADTRVTPCYRTPLERRLAASGGKALTGGA
ncbi:winged helix DNA-binding domain-containing protein [Streptomyces sp. NPDC058662]|uniref:winged helix DNA-binding domain-containing protein n=1 Tax=Streptomyces sp. NPDC058662 TaxID=3346583 RepID=UPI0036695CCF